MTSKDFENSYRQFKPLSDYYHSSTDTLKKSLDDIYTNMYNIHLLVDNNTSPSNDKHKRLRKHFEKLQESLTTAKRELKTLTELVEYTDDVMPVAKN